MASTIAAAAVVSQKKSEQSHTQRRAFGGGRAMHSLSVRLTPPCGRAVKRPPRQGLLGFRGEPGRTSVSGIDERQFARCMF